jgi:signal transduction histidine kinase
VAEEGIISSRGLVSPPDDDPEPGKSAVAVARYPDLHRTGSLEPADSLAQLDVLLRLSHAFASATTLDEVGRSVGRWVRAATGSDRATFRLLVPDAGGRLRTVASDEVSEGGRKRSARRRQVFRDRSPVFVSLNRPPGHRLGLFPLISRGEPVGMLEVTAPSGALEEREDLLTAVASQTAIAVRNARERRFLEQLAEPALGFMNLVRDLVAAPTPRRAVAVAVRLCFEQLEVPVAGWGMADDRSRLELTAMRGVDSQTRQRLRSSMRTLPPWERKSRAERNRFTAMFGELTGTGTAVTVGDAGDAVLLIGGGSDARAPFIESLVALLRDVLRNLAITARAERRNRHLDMGIAWTAHELRRPMLALRYLLLSLGEEQSIEEGVQILTRQLDDLVKGVDGMLRWATGEPPAESRAFNLVGVVAGVVEALRVEAGPGRLRFKGRAPVMVRGDSSQVRHAIENLVVNALAYSPPETDVRIAVEPDEDGVTVTVADRGPGVPAAFRDAIFDPFVRAGVGGQPRGGQGLGLFIAKQIVEGHGGALWLEPARKGATFRLRLPREASGS